MSGRVPPTQASGTEADILMQRDILNYWKSETRTPHEFRALPYPLGETDPVGGVYIFAHQIDGVFNPPQMRVIYVGQTGRAMSVRIDEHKTEGRLAKIASHQPTHLLFHVESDEDRRLQIEAEVIGAERPLVNGTSVRALFNTLLAGSDSPR